MLMLFSKGLSFCKTSTPASVSPTICHRTCGGFCPLFELQLLETDVGKKNKKPQELFE